MYTDNLLNLIKKLRNKKNHKKKERERWWWSEPKDSKQKYVKKKIIFLFILHVEGDIFCWNFGFSISIVVNALFIYLYILASIYDI